MAQGEILEERVKKVDEDRRKGGKWRGENKEEHVTNYLELSKRLSEKIGAGLLVIYEKVLTTNQVEMHAENIGNLEYFHGMLNKQIDLVERRVIHEEESGKTFKKLRHKHSAVESDINRLEYHGLDRCPDKGLNAFKREKQGKRVEERDF